MINIIRIIYSLLAVLASTMMFVPNLCYASPEVISVEELDLECCTVDTCPTKAASEGIPEVQQTVEIKGVRMEGIHLPDELQIGEGFHDVIMLSRDPAYPEWKRKMISSLPREEARRILRTSMTDLNMRILVRCSGLAVDETATSISHPGKSVTCPVGDGVVLEQDKPKCDEDGTGPESVVMITKTRAPTEEEKLASAMQAKAALEEAVAKRDALLAKLAAKEAENAKLKALSSGYDQEMDQINREREAIKQRMVNQATQQAEMHENSKTQKVDKKAAAKEEKARQEKLKKEKAKQEKAEKERAKKEKKGKGKSKAVVGTAAVAAGIGAMAIIGSK